MKKKNNPNVGKAMNAVRKERWTKAKKRAKADKKYRDQKRRILELYRLAKKLKDGLK